VDKCRLGKKAFDSDHRLAVARSLVADSPLPVSSGVELIEATDTVGDAEGIQIEEGTTQGLLGHAEVAPRRCGGREARYGTQQLLRSEPGKLLVTRDMPGEAGFWGDGEL
jgi:hypothetical protein